MQLTVKDNSDGTFSLLIDGAPYTDDDDAKTELVRDTIEDVISDARSIFGGHADTIEVPEGTPASVLPPVVTPPPEPTPTTPDASTTPAGPAPPAVEPNPIPPAVSPTQ